MAKEICISTTPHETRLAILEDDQLAEIYYERENEYTLAGSIYKGRVTRVLPGMQSSFVDLGLERDAFLYVTDFLEEQEDGEEYETSSGGGQAERPAEAAAEERRPRRDNRREGRKAGRPDSAEPAAAAPDERPVAAALQSAQPSEADREDKGDEESPQGTRRWRGRRGRRRGGMRAGVLGAAVPAAADLPPTAAAPFALAEHGAPGGLAAPLPPAPAADDMDEEPEPLELQAAAEAAEPPRRAPEPVSERKRDERRQPVAVLPGESLSKYGAAPAAPSAPSVKAAAAPSRPAGTILPRPKTEVAILAGWDGGAVLPGESLSRYKREKGSAEPVPASFPAEALGQPETVPAPEVGAGQPTPEVHAEQPLEATPEALFPEMRAEGAGEAVQPAPESAGDAAALANASVEDGAALANASADDSDEAIEVAIGAAISSQDPLPGETVAEALPGATGAEEALTAAEPIDAGQQTEWAIEESADYEPLAGEASVRFAPPGTSELRIGQWFTGGESARALPDEQDQPRATAVEPERSSEALPELDGAAGGATSVAKDQGSAHDAVVAPEVEPGRSTLDAGAEMTGPWQEPAAAYREEPSILAPLAEESERALEASISLHGVGMGESNDGFADLVDQLQGFSPGSGLLEEEVIDEDEYDFELIGAHPDEHDLEDLEEEILDGESDGESGNGYAITGMDASLQAGEPEEDEDEDEEETPPSPSYSPAASPFFEQVHDEEDAAEPLGAGEPERRERPGDDRGRRGGRNGRRRGTNGGGGGGARRQSAQVQDLPIISDLLKQGQEILVQIAKEPIAKKGARITSHIALPGRFLVFMPTVSHVGVSRKIDSDEERQRLKRILISEKADNSGGFIVRTAAEGASEEELRADLRFLISLWAEIKQRADTAKAPALLYHDLNLVERILRDQVSSNFSAIWVDTEQEYERIVRFLNRFQPSLVRRVKLYTKETPLFEHFGVQEEISKALKSKVWLKSGGSIVINQTEALVAIDINTGKYVGKTARLEDTIVKTNLDAIPEIVRQIRLRDLGGIIVIDFIDMDERKNRNRVLQALEEAMKVDRAPSKVLQFNDFGLVAITRKRVKQSLERTLSVQCETCAGTGMVKSPITVCNEIFIELRKMQSHLEGKDVMLRVHPEVVKQLKGGSGRWINEYEEMVGKTIIIKSDPSLHPEQFDIH